MLVISMLCAALFWIGYSHGDEAESDPPVAILTGALVAAVPLALGALTTLL